MPSQTGSIDLTAQVSANNNAKDYSDNVVDNLEIGGRNLLPWSAPSAENYAKIAVPSSSNSFTTEDGYACYKITGGATNGTHYASSGKSLVSLEADTQYTYSAWVKLTTTGSATSVPFNFTSLGHFSIINAASTASDKTHEDVSAKRIYSPSMVNVGVWTKIQLTFTTNSLDGSKFGLYPKYNLGDTYTLFIRNQKLEKGNKATDWTPAPEDQEALVTSTRNWYATCDTAEGTVAKTATTTDEGFELREGVVVDVKFTNTNTGAVGSLTLNVNNTGAKSIKTMYNNSLANLTHAGQLYAGLVVRFVYSGTYWIAATNYNSNDYDRKRINNAVRAAENITAYAVCGRSGTGHKKLVSGLAIDLSYPIAYLSSGNLSGQSYAVASGGTSTVFYTSIPTVNLQYTKASWTGTQYAMCYVKGTLSGATFTVHSDVFTTTVPTSDDGFAYIPIGMMVSTYQVNFDCDNTVYAYRNGKFQKFDTVANYITADANGISIHMANESNTYQRQTSNSTIFYVGGKKRSQVGADGLHVYVDSTEDEVAHFGESARIGKSSGFNTLIEEDEFAIRYATDRLFDVSSDGKTTSIYMGGSTLPSGYKYTDNQLSTIYDYLQSGCTVSGRVVLDPNGSDTTWRLSDDGYGFLYDAAGDQIISPGLGEIEYLPSTGTWTIDPPLQPQSEIPGAPVSIDMGNVGIRASNNRLIIMASGVAEGGGTTASGSHSHAEGSYTTASGTCSHAEGASTTATKAYSHTEGYNATASGTSSHAEGSDTSASGISSHAEGAYTTASGDYSHAQNQGTIAGYPNQTVIGKYNDNGYRALEIGNGTSSSSRSNAFAVDWNGNIMARGMAGMVQMFAGSTPPTGWLLCHGQAISRTDYATLFAAIGTTWGSGNGSTTFNIPDLRGRAPIGAGTGSGLTARTLAAKGGSENIQAHTHAFTQPTVKTELKFQKNTASGSAINRVAGSNLSNPAETSTYTATVTGGAVGAVSGASTGTAGNMPPFAVINFIICTGKTS